MTTRNSHSKPERCIQVGARRDRVGAGKLALLAATEAWACPDDGPGGGDPVLMLDDVFAELDTDRRERLAALAAGAEQVLVTAAVPDDLPAPLRSTRFDVTGGVITRAG